MNAHPRDAKAAHSVGSVAEEAARIIGMFSTGLDADALQAAGARAAGTPRPSRPTAVACPTCGQEAREASPDSVCRVCPVCRVLAVVRSINPDTLERVADVVDLLSDGLRTYASGRREVAAREAAAREARAAEAAAAAGVRDVTAEFFPEDDGADDASFDDALDGEDLVEEHSPEECHPDDLFTEVDRPDGAPAHEALVGGQHDRWLEARPLAPRRPGSAYRRGSTSRPRAGGGASGG